MEYTLPRNLVQALVTSAALRFMSNDVCTKDVHILPNEIFMILTLSIAPLGLTIPAGIAQNMA